MARLVGSIFLCLVGVATSLVGPSLAPGGPRSLRATHVVRGVLAEPAVDLSPADLAKDFDLKAYFAKKVAAVEKALDESLTCTTPETKIIVESMRRALPRPRAGRGSFARVVASSLRGLGRARPVAPSVPSLRRPPRMGR